MVLTAEEVTEATLGEELLVDVDSSDHGERVAARLGTLVNGTYRLIRQVGAGGMSDVFAAEHVRLGRHCGVRQLAQADPRVLGRLIVRPSAADAEVLVDGLAHLGAQLPSGVHRVVIQRDGYLTWEQTVRVPPGGGLALSPTLRRTRMGELRERKKKASDRTLATILAGTGAALGLNGLALYAYSGNRYEEYQSAHASHVACVTLAFVLLLAGPGLGNRRPDREVRLHGVALRWPRPTE